MPVRSHCSESAACACPASILSAVLEGGAPGTWRELSLPLASECTLARFFQPPDTVPDGAGTFARVLQRLPSQLVTHPTDAIQRILHQFAVPRDELTTHERNQWHVAYRAVEQELHGLCEGSVKRACALDPDAVVRYWRAEQEKVEKPWGELNEAVSCTLTIPRELAGLASDVKCRRPGCPGSLLLAERFVGAVDEASVSILKCCQPSCRYQIRADAIR